MFANTLSQRYVSDRLERLRGFLLITAVAFAFFSVFYFVQAKHATSIVCALDGIAAIVLTSFAQRFPNRRELIAHLFLGISMSGLAFISMFTGGARSYTPMFLSLAGVMAGHMLGVRAAFWWTITAIACVYFVVFGTEFFQITQIQFHGPLDFIANTIAIIAIVFLMGWHAESFFELHAERLTTMTEQLQERTRLLSLAEEVASVGHWRIDLDEKKIRFSEVACEICGLDIEPLEPHDLNVFFSRFDEEQAAKLQRALTATMHYPRSFSMDGSFTLGGSVRHVTIRGISEQDADANITAVFGIVKDDTDSKYIAMELTEKAQALHQLATYDPLTDLCNRHQFQINLQEALNRAEENQCTSALLLMDMDGFKEVNDTMGHSSGDEILRRIADRLKLVVRDNDTVARLGGDEFTVILNSVGDVETTLRRASAVANAVKQPYELKGTRVELGASIGAALFPDHSVSMDDLLAFADTAMYQAKADGNDVALYMPQMTDDLRRRKRIERRLARAMDHDEFILVYQPQYRIVGRRLVGFEALIRWESEGIQVSPNEFIPILERTQTIVDVGAWILESATKQAKEWVDVGYDIRMSVNISPVQFHMPDFVDVVKNILQRSKLEPHRLDLELTEGVLIEDVPCTSGKIDELKALGISISIDDFGTGYSSFAYLKRLAIDRLKIDREFIRDIPNSDDGTIASSMVVLGHNLDMEVLAEGVETEQQLKFLGDIGCELCQGYLLSKPLSLNDCEKLLSEFQGADNFQRQN